MRDGARQQRLVPGIHRPLITVLYATSLYATTKALPECASCNDRIWGQRNAGREGRKSPSGA